MANEDQKDYDTIPIGTEIWRRRWKVALDTFDRSGLAFVPQPSTVIIKGDASLQIQKTIYIKGDAFFTSFAIYIKGDTSLVAERHTLIKGDTRFSTVAIYIKGDVALAENIPLPDLGRDPPSTKPGAISRFWLQVNSVKKDVT